jgi:predicted dehydrogenase
MTNGIVYTYRGSWCAEGLNTGWESEWRIIGEKGTIKWDGGEKIEGQAVAETGGFQSKLRELNNPNYDSRDRIGGHSGLIREFVDCVRQGQTPETICTDNIKSLAMVFGAIESVKTNKRVSIEL